MTKINDPPLCAASSNSQLCSSAGSQNKRDGLAKFFNFNSKTQRIPIFILTFIATIHLMMDVSITN